MFRSRSWIARFAYEMKTENPPHTGWRIQELRKCEMDSAQSALLTGTMRVRNQFRRMSRKRADRCFYHAQVKWKEAVI